MSEARIVVLAENRAGGRKLLGEHGLAYWIEIQGMRILFDTGQELVLRRNASILRVNLEQTDSIILSHGHYDYSGGLSEVFSAVKGRIPLYAHPASFSTKFSCDQKRNVRNIGMTTADKEAVQVP